MAAGLVRVVNRHMAFLGPDSQRAAEAAECAAEQGQFFAFRDRLYLEQGPSSKGAFAAASLKRYALELGLDTARFSGCLDGARYAERVRAEAEVGRSRGVRATPTIFVNGQKIEGLPTWEALRLAIDRAAAAAR